MFPLKEPTKALFLTIAMLLATASLSQAQFTVSGTVQTAGAAPVASATVTLYDNAGTPIGIPLTQTNAAGFYSIAGLPNGSYQLRFVPTTGVALLHSWQAFSVAGINLTVNATLNPGHIVSGFIRNSGGIGIPNLDINVTDNSTGDPVETPGDNTDISGFYDIVIPTGTYDFRFRPVNGEALIPLDSTGILIVANKTINVTLIAALILSGTVTGPGGVAIFDADLDVVDVTTGIKLATAGDNTNIAGFYDVTIPPGTYDIDIDPLPGSGLMPAISLGVVVSSNHVLNFSLEAGSTVSGLVRDPFLVAVDNVDIDFTNETTGESVYLTTDKTDPTGNYSVTSPHGTFSVDFQPNLATGLAPLRQTGVVVSTNMTLHANLVAGLNLSGHVTNSFAMPVENVDIDAKFVSTGVAVPLLGDNTDALGDFATVLGPGTYDIEVEPPASRRLASQRFTAISLALDTALSVTLDTGMVISGIVRDTDNTVFANVRLTALTSPGGDTAFISSSKTDLLGAYSSILPVGTYDLIYKPDSALGRTDSVLVAGVTLSADMTQNINFTGAPPAPQYVISGTIMDQLPAPVANVDVTVLEVGGTPIVTYPNATDALGAYSLPPIDEGTYWLFFSPELASGLDIKIVTDVVLSTNITVDVSLVPCPGSCGCCATAGDADHTGTITIGDVTFMISMIFASGPTPVCSDEADANGSNSLSIGDVTFLIQRIFGGGPAPVCGTTGS